MKKLRLVEGIRLSFRIYCKQFNIILAPKTTTKSYFRSPVAIIINGNLKTQENRHLASKNSCFTSKNIVIDLLLFSVDKESY